MCVVSNVLVFHFSRSIIRVTKQRGGMYHRKRKRSKLREPYFFYKISQKNRGTITPKDYFRPLTGDPGGSDLVSIDTKGAKCTLYQIMLLQIFQSQALLLHGLRFDGTFHNQVCC